MRLLDLFCGAGGAAMGYHRAGFDEIIGVDIKLQKNYPFTFVLGDALEYLREHGHEFDFIHASPPCQAFSQMRYANHDKGQNHPDLVAPVRELLIKTGVPWVIENVPGAPLINPVVLCGLAFGLRVLRHRLFESSFFFLAPPHVTHPKQEKVRGKVAPGYLDTLKFIGFTTGSSMKAFRDAMECQWMTPNEGRQAIPPAYTEYIGGQILALIQEPTP